MDSDADERARLEPCVRCGGYFPPERLSAHDKAPYCPTCHAHVSGVRFSPPPPLAVPPDVDPGASLRVPRIGGFEVEGRLGPKGVERDRKFELPPSIRNARSAPAVPPSLRPGATPASSATGSWTSSLPPTQAPPTTQIPPTTQAPPTTEAIPITRATRFGAAAGAGPEPATSEARTSEAATSEPVSDDSGGERQFRGRFHSLPPDLHGPVSSFAQRAGSGNAESPSDDDDAIDLLAGDPGADDALLMPASADLASDGAARWSDPDPFDAPAAISRSAPPRDVNTNANLGAGAGMGASLRTSPGAHVNTNFGGPAGLGPGIAVCRATDELFDEYAALRQGFAGGGAKQLATVRRAAELAARLGLQLESIEHYKECLELDPGNAELEVRLANIQRAVQVAAEPEADVRTRERRIAPEDPPFWTDLGGVLTYPLRRGGPPVVLFGGVIFGLADLTTHLSIFGGLVAIALVGFVSAYLFEVINCTASGRESPPPLPEVTSPLESFVYPFFAMLVCGVIAFLPAILAGAAWGAFLPDWLGLPLLLVLIPVGVFIYPMALMIRAMFQSTLEVLNPKVLFGSIGRVLPDYMLAFVFICGAAVTLSVVLMIVGAAITLALGMPTADAVLEMNWARILGWVLFTLIRWPLFLYVWMVQGHLLGRLYRQGLRRLAWFVPHNDDSRQATRISFAIAAAGVGAAVLISFVGYGLVTLAGPAASLGNTTYGTPCPLKDGSRLSYYWASSEGPSGLVTYKVSRNADGTMRLDGATLLARDIGRPPLVEHVGDFDTASGLMVTSNTFYIGESTATQKVGTHTWLYGPPDVGLGVEHINGWTVQRRSEYQRTWTVTEVRDPDTTTSMLYDTKTGILVGRKFQGVGFFVKEWLVDVQGVPGLAPGPDCGVDFFPDK